METTLVMFDLPAIQPGWERVDKNRAMRPAGWDESWWECAVCGRPTNQNAAGSVWARMSEGGELYPAGTTDEQVAASGHGDMGGHPIGASCARKIPKAYLTR